MFGTGCDFEDNNEEEDKGAFPECSLEVAARGAPSHSTLCCPSACAHMHAHTHTDSIPPSTLVYGTVSQERPAGGCAGEAGFTGHLAGGVGGLPGKRCGQNLQSSLLQGRGSVCPWERWPRGCASPMGGKRQPALCQVTAS